MIPIWIQLGRMGDVLNLLPLLHQDWQNGKRRTLMVSSEFSSVTEGCSYFDTIVYNGPSYDIPGAVEQLDLKEWICTQVNAAVDVVKEFVYAPNGMDKAKTTSFQKEQWRIAGRLKSWDDCLPLIFDKRNKDRELDLFLRCGFSTRGRKRPLMLVALEGKSSPFPYTELLMKLLQGMFGDTYRIETLPRAERIYDLLGLYECADVLVASDSAPLHLAWATPRLPVIAFTNDKPLLWNGASWRPNHHFYCRYSDFHERLLEMIQAIEKLRGEEWNEVPVAVNVWSEYQQKRQYANDEWVSLPIAKGMCGRDTSMVQDTKRLPYLKDCIRMGLQKSNGGFVCITQPDTQMREHTKGIVKLYDACFAYRMLKDGETETFQPTVDLFCASNAWWKSHLDEIPDYVLGRDYWWTHGLRGLFAKYGAVDITGEVYKVPSKSADAPVRPPLPPRIKINKTLAEKYITDQKICCRYPRVSEQVEVVASFSGKLRNAYNPTLIEHGGKILMACRYHPVETPSTSLMLVELNKDFTIAKSEPLEIAGVSVEDPKLFNWNGKLCMSWVDAEWPTKDKLRSIVRWGMFEYETFNTLSRPEVPGNDGSTAQKNYVLFQPSSWLACLSQCQPEQVIYRLDSEEVHRSAGPRWSYGTIRGGTVPVPYEGKWLRFFHGHLDNEFGMFNRRYYMGALLMNPKPPFEVVRVSFKPIIYGSEIDQLKVKDRPKHWKANVVFPSGVLERDGHWIVSVGVNDSASLLVKISPNDLHL